MVILLCPTSGGVFLAHRHARGVPDLFGGIPAVSRGQGQVRLALASERIACPAELQGICHCKVRWQYSSTDAQGPMASPSEAVGVLRMRVFWVPSAGVKPLFQSNDRRPASGDAPFEITQPVAGGPPAPS